MPATTPVFYGKTVRPGKEWKTLENPKKTAARHDPLAAVFYRIW